MAMSAVIGYHRHVRPIKGPVIAAIGGAFFAFLLGYGYYRSFGSIEAPFSAATEFQSLMATALHIKHMTATGELPPFPWQARWSEFVNFIPQQLAPFHKIDPSDWYLTVIGNDSSGLMFSVLSQAAIGFGRPELVARGLLLGIILAVLHNALARPGTLLAATFYIWLTCMSYYTYRATTLYLATEALLFFCPFALLTVVTARAFRRSGFRHFVNRRGFPSWHVDPNTTEAAQQ
jgi:hypothetical protein